MEESKLEEKIKLLTKQLETETLVSERIRKYVQSKTDLLNSKADE